MDGRLLDQQRWVYQYAMTSKLGKSIAKSLSAPYPHHGTSNSCSRTLIVWEQSLHYGPRAHAGNWSGVRDRTRFSSLKARVIASIRTPRSGVTQGINELA